MSHSAFSLSANEPCVNNRNLVIVVKKDGTLAADQEALQELLVSKGNPNTAISLLRETSPTPSISEEIEDERKQRMLYLREQYLAEHNEDQEIDEDELEQKLLEATADDTEIPHVTLSVESFYPADQARKFVNDVLHLGGIRDPKTLLPVDFHYQRMIIHNDHCYTPLTRSIAPETTELPISKTKEKIAGVIKQPKPAKVRQPTADSEDSEMGETIGEDEEDVEDENSSNEAISFSESDDEDDLDFSVNDRFGTKKPRKIKSGRNKSSRRNKARNSNSSSFKDLIDGEMESMFQEAEPVPVKPNLVQVVTKKKNIKSPKKIQVRPSTSTAIKNMTNVIIIKPEKPVPTNTQSVAQAVKKIQQQLHMSSKSNSQKLPEGVKKVIYPDMSSHLSHPIKEFVPLTANLLKNNNMSQFPGHISIQTHNSSEMEFVESMVNDLEKNFPSPEKKMNVIAGPSNPSVIPNIVQMLETSTPAEMIDQSLSSLEHTIMDTVAGTDPNFEGIEDALFAALGNEVLEELFDKVQESGELMNFTPNAVPMRNNLNSSHILPNNNINLIINESRPTTSTLLQSPPVKVLNSKGNSKDPIKYIRNGRIITLPPIEAPTTRGAKRRAQGSTSELNVSTASLNTSQLSTKMPKLEKTPSTKDPDSRNSSRRSSLNKSESSRGSRRQSGALGIVAAVAAGLPQAVGNDEEMDDLGSDETWNSEDDPDRLWCICKQPHNNRFMICCDKCVDWFHGKCVNITKSMGREMEELGIEWRCPNCKQNKGSGESTPTGKKQQPTKKQQKLTKFFKNKGTKDEDSVQMCLVCKEQPARNSSIYCSDDCIRNHASKHGGEEEEEKEKEKEKEVVPLKRGNVLKDKSGNVVVFDRISGKVLPMAKSPHASVLSQWLAQHPNFEPVKPGSPQADLVLNRPKVLPQVVSQEPSAVTQSKDELFSNPVKIVTGITPVSPVKKTINQGQPVRIVQVSNTSRTVQGFKTGTSVPSNKLPVKAPVKASTTASGSSKFKVEQERLNVRNILKETLAQRMTEFEHPDIKKMTDDEITEFARATEREMFLYFNKDTREKYKIKFRSLKFNLGDTKNRTLLERICSKMLSPKQLVELPPSALASEELAKWRDNETKHQLEIITKSELDALAQTQVHVVKTHKGEEIIETKSDLLSITTVLPGDDVESIINSSALSTEDNSLLSPTIQSHKDRYDLSKSLAVSVQISSSPLSSPSVTSSTGAKKSDSRVRSRSRSKSKGKDHHSHHHSSHHHKSSSSSSSTKHKKSERHRSKSRDKKDFKKTTSNRERDDKERKSREEKRKSNDVKEVIKKELPKEQKPKIVKKPVVKVEVDLVGEILGAMGANIEKPIKKEESVKKIEKQEEKLQLISSGNKMVIPPLIFHEPEILSTDPNVEIEIYSGNLFMNDVAKFNVTACSVSGFVEDVIKELSSQLEVVGRITPAAVWDYLENIMKFPGKEIAIIRFSSTDDANYTALYSYLHSRDRVGVIRVDSTKIKDLYLVPVQGGHPLPKVLLPLKGPGFIEGDLLRPDMLIGVIVKVLPVLKVRRPVKKVLTTTQKHSRSSSLQLIQSLPPIKSTKPSKLTMNLPNADQLLKASTSQNTNDDDDEPYTPFDDDSSTPPPQYIGAASNENNKHNTSDDYEIAQLEKQIAKKQMEKRQLINQIPDGAYENIELPSNLTEILSRFQNSSVPTGGGGGDNVGMSIDDDDDDDDDEYVPTAMTGIRNVEYRPNAPMLVIPPPSYNPQSSLMDIDERIFQQVPPQHVVEESKLSTMSEADLMKLVPDGMDLDPPPMTSNINKQPAIPGLDVYDTMDA